MIVGHFAVALGAKRYAPEISLGILFVACQLADILMPLLFLAGIEQLEIEVGATVMMPLNLPYYPFSHSLLVLALWSAVLACAFVFLRRARYRAGIAIAILGISHWLLDVLMHRPDVPLTIGDEIHLGFGLWNFPAIAVPLELGLFGIGIWLYTRYTSPRNRNGTLGFGALVVFLLATYFAIHFGPTMPSAEAVAWSGLAALCLIIAWAFWVDGNRQAASG
jgi:uncharacterized MnhB-related membrane protein